MDTPPLIASTQLSFVMPDFKSAFLSNGTPVYIVPSATKDVLTITFAMRHGACRDDVQGETCLTLEMLKQGTERYTAKEFSEEVESRGCWIRCAADHDISTVQVTGLGEWFDDVTDLMADCVLRPRFDAEELDKLRARSVADMMIDLSDVDWLASRAATQCAYTTHPYARPREGTPASLATITVDNLRKVHRHLLAAPRWIIVAGPVDPQEAVERLEALFGALQPSGQPQPMPPAVKSRGLGMVASNDGALQTSFRIILPGLPMGHPDYAAAQLLTNVLGGFTLARLFTILREEKGYTYGAYASPMVRSLDASIVISTSVGNEFTADTIATISQEVSRLGSQRIDEDELENARQQIVGSFARSCETPQQTAWLLHTIVNYELPFDYFEQYVRRVQELAPDDLLPVQSALFSTASWVVGAAGVTTLVESAISPFVNSVSHWDRQGF
jgi:predicted Zn-dependent peptidase